jgi:hypothetical protein
VNNAQGLGPEKVTESVRNCIRHAQSRITSPKVLPVRGSLELSSRCRFQWSLSNPSAIDVQFALCTAIHINSRTSIQRSRRYEGGHASCRSASH